MGQMIRKTITASFTKAAAPRTYDVTMSTGRRDRELDDIPVEGWIIPLFVPLLWGHDHKGLPIGRVWDVRVEGNAMRGRIEFPPVGVYAFADTVVGLIETGFIGSFSVGFRIIDRPIPNDAGGLTFVGAKELMELSAVNVAANVDATIDRMDAGAMAKWMAAGDDPNEIVIVFDERALPESQSNVWPSGVVASRQQLEDFLAGVDEEDQASAKFDPLRDAIASITQFLEALTDAAYDQTAGRRSHDPMISVRASQLTATIRNAVAPLETKLRALQRQRTYGDDDVAVRFHDSPDDEFTVDPADLPAAIAAAMAKEIGDVVKTGLTSALNHARGRID